MLLRRVSSLVGRAAVRPRSIHTEARLKELGIELPTPKAPLGKRSSSQDFCVHVLQPGLPTLLVCSVSYSSTLRVDQGPLSQQNYCCMCKAGCPLYSESARHELLSSHAVLAMLPLLSGLMMRRD